MTEGKICRACSVGASTGGVKAARPDPCVCTGCAGNEVEYTTTTLLEFCLRCGVAVLRVDELVPCYHKEPKLLHSAALRAGGCIQLREGMG